jgi:Mn2+/Fe2+ NRAMP family transporter
MGSVVGFIPAVIGGKKVPLSPVGAIFKLAPENLKTWKIWEKLLHLDLWLIFFIGGMFGMLLPAMIVSSLVPVGTTLPAWGIAAHVSNQFAAKVGPWGYYFIALIGFFILFSTQLGVLDELVRVVTDTLWNTSEGVRKWAKGDVRRIYYPFLAIYLIFACFAMWAAAPLILLLIGANVTHFLGIWLIPVLTYLDRKLIPKELRTPLWVIIITWTMWAFHLFFAIALTLYYGFGIKIF